MRRVRDGVVRPGWQETVTAQGLTYWETELPDDSTTSYWREGQFHDFTHEEVAQLDRDAATPFEMCAEAGDHMVAHPELMLRMGIPEFAHAAVVGTWNDEPSRQSVVGRFDVRYGADSRQSRLDPTLRRPQLLESNADTPTSLPESTYVQCEWFSETGRGRDQWNSIFERLTRARERNLGLIEKQLRRDPVVCVACDGADRSGEDLFNTFLVRDACTQVTDGGRPRYRTRSIMMNQITHDEATGGFFEGDPADGRHFDVLFKLYPCEWLVHDDFGRAAFADMDRPGGTVWIETPYKMLWSDKGLLPVLDAGVARPQAAAVPRGRQHHRLRGREDPRLRRRRLRRGGLHAAVLRAAARLPRPRRLAPPGAGPVDGRRRTRRHGHPPRARA